MPKTNTKRKDPPWNNCTFDLRANKTFSPPTELVKTLLQEARLKVVQAAAQTNDEVERTNLLNLLEVFREYTEKGRVRSVAGAISSQVATIESVTRKLKEQVKAPQKALYSTMASIPTATSTSTLKTRATPPSTQPNQRSPSLSPPQTTEWTTVGGKTKTTHQKHSPRKVVLTLDNKTQDFNPKQTRDKVNAFFNTLGWKSPICATATKSGNNNLVLSINPIANITDADLHSAMNKPAFKSIIPFQEALNNEKWFKVIVHGVSTNDFNTPEGGALIKEEVESFNLGLKVVGTPFWATKPEKRGVQMGGSVFIAFRTKEEANRAVQHRLFIGGVSLRVEHAREQARTNQPRSTQQSI